MEHLRFAVGYRCLIPFITQAMNFGQCNEPKIRGVGRK